MVIYLIEVTNKIDCSHKISQEGYSQYQKAVNFIESRNDNPIQISNYCRWESEERIYEICEVNIK